MCHPQPLWVQARGWVGGMRILLVADGRSPITRSWIRAVLSLGHSVILVSTFPCEPVEGVEADVCLPVAFSALARSGGASGPAAGSTSQTQRVVSSFRSLFMAGRYYLGPLTLNYYGPRFRWLAEKIQPDMIHALRIPFEGMLASWAPPDIPLAVSIWGNDLTLHANGSPQMARLTRKVLARADALVADAARDIRLGRAWGFSPEKPTLVVPGNGGLDLDELSRARLPGTASPFLAEYGFPPDSTLVINPRGFRTGSVRQDTFFAALPLIYERLAHSGRDGSVTFACAAMAGQSEAQQLVSRYHLEGKVILLPLLPQKKLWELFASAAVSISVSQHDGTPNSLLEAMALGALPVAGDIESIREWITPGVNGLLVEPDKPQALAEAVLLALENPALRASAAECNARLVSEHASAQTVGEKIQALYSGLVKTPADE